MKGILLWILLLGTLCGCSLFRSDTYVVVEPHDEGYEVAIDSSAVTVSSYLGLKNAMGDMVEKSVTDGVIRAEGYSGVLTDDLDHAVYEVWRVDPLGAYAVDYMTYDCSKIVNYYEIHVHITYRRTQEEIRSVEYAASVTELKERLGAAMAEYRLVQPVQVNDHSDMDYNDLVQEIYDEHPEFAMELPRLTVNHYPETGSQRILEFSFDYSYPQETLLEMKAQAEESLAYIVKLYGSANDDMVSVRRFYNRVIRDGILVNEQEAEPVADSVYGVLKANRATSCGYARTYALLLRYKDIPCVLLRSSLENEPRYLCLLTLEDAEYYVDVAAGVLDPTGGIFLMTRADLELLGYTVLE